MVGPGRLELPTSRLSGVRSNHLSYGPEVDWILAPKTWIRCQGPGPIGDDRKYVACEERETKAAKFRMSTL
jgi:hypothetical protein